MRTDVVVALLCAGLAVVQSLNNFRDCYDKFNKPQRCLCDFENPAFGLEVEATNTCGEEQQSEFCVQSGSSTTQACQNCTFGEHPPSSMTDLQTQGNITWWQSETMADGLQYPESVNLTFPLNKAYDITYVRIVFQSPRPESFVIYKRTKKDDPWVPFQYYSADCRNLFGLEDRAYALETDETAPLCTSAYSDISPLSGGSIAFATLEGRKSALVDFDHNAALHDWVTATEIRIQLTRMNTFGDEVYGGENVFRSYYYAISDVSIGARCKCNGHASICDPISLPNGSRGRRCRCEHNTAGDDCERCADFYQDTKWKRATASDAGVCIGSIALSSSCTNFDGEVWAIYEAVTRFLELPQDLTSVVFLLDSQSAILALYSSEAPDDHLLLAQKSLGTPIKRGWRDVLQWIPSKFGVAGNAYDIAKTRSNMPPHDEPTTHN